MKITLCGSTRFQNEFEKWNRDLGLAGHVVYTLSCFGREADDTGKDGNYELTEGEKITLDLVHLLKIVNSDAIVIINPGGYMGFSTKREAQFAAMSDKGIFAIEQPYAVSYELGGVGVMSAGDLLGLD